MSKTFKMTVNFPLTLVVSTETVKEFTEAREEARKVLYLGKVLKGENKFRVELLASDKTDDEVLETIFRAGVRQVLREDFLKGVCGNESKGRMGDVKVVYQTAPKRSCQGCIETNCVKSEKNTNSGCDGKRVGIREPGPRWTETV
jgi:hypothetical protein